MYVPKGKIIWTQKEEEKEKREKAVNVASDIEDERAVHSLAQTYNNWKYERRMNWSNLVVVKILCSKWYFLMGSKLGLTN